MTTTVLAGGRAPGEIKGTMAFDRKQCGMNSGIPFIKIANRLEVSVNLKAKRWRLSSANLSSALAMIRVLDIGSTR
jgi:hypothetical protein